MSVWVLCFSAGRRRSAAAAPSTRLTQHTLTKQTTAAAAKQRDGPTGLTDTSTQQPLVGNVNIKQTQQSPSFFN